MPAAAPATEPPSALRVGLSAGKSLLGGLMLGIALAVLLGCSTAVFYFLRLNGPGMPAAAHAGGAGAVIALLASPSLIVALLLARFPLGGRVGRTMFIAVAVFGLATIVFGLSRSFPLSLAALAVLGAADMISVVVRSSFVQLETPDAMRGRVSAVNSVFIGTSNQLGEFESGLTAAWFGAVPAVLIGGIGTLLIVLLWMRLFPSLYQVDRLAARQS